ncbi:MAG TPA: hypothetical protein PK093_23645 [Phycisphaerae bacterium]|nr:hypothetical protein [Phycisphaerae bacterium]
MARLWINVASYINVDSDGYVYDKDCLEGALGCVIKVYGGEEIPEGRTIRALKIPRYLADTTRENAFIDTLLENEHRVVQRVFAKAPESGFLGLLRSTSSDGIPPMRQLAPRHVRYCEGSGKEKELGGGLFLFSFKKSKPPRMACLRVSSGEEVAVFPELPELRKVVEGDDDLQAKLANLQDADPRKHVTYRLCVEANSRIPSKCEELSSHLEDEDSDSDVWYILPPSILYDWGFGNLQEVISTGRLHDWGISKHLKLSRTVLQGLQTLHQKQFLHGDIRPANVMYVGGWDEPEQYVLIDYGSFNDAPRAVDLGTPGGQTLLGPSVRPERQSPFYSKERRIASEFESADTAFIWCDHALGLSNDSEDKGGILIRLGWRNCFDSGEGKGHRVAENQRKLIREALQASAKQMMKSDAAVSTTGLVRDDLVRLREFVFRIYATRRSGEFLDILCRPECYKVLHDRISIPAKLESVDDGVFLSVPRVIEMRQLSCATDVYSVGVLLLYTVFCGKAFQSTAAQSNNAGPGVEESKANLNEQSETLRVEKEFREFVATLENTTYFHQLWPRVGEVCHHLEECFRNKVADLREFEYSKVDGRDGAHEDANLNDRVVVKLDDELVSLVERIAYTVPGVSRMLRVIDKNIAHFAFLMQFVLCCMHRVSEIESRSHSRVHQMPFCGDRLSGFAENAVAGAITRLQKLQEMVSREYFDEAFGNRDINIPEDINEIRPPADLYSEVKDLRNEVQAYQSKQQRLEEAISNVQKCIRDAKADLNRGTVRWMPAVKEALQRLDIAERASVDTVLKKVDDAEDKVRAVQ